jgi:Glycosyl hydrolase family 63 C-terminal domain
VIEELPTGSGGKEHDDILLSLVPRPRLDKLIKALLDEKEFLSKGGIRSISKIHEHGYNVNIDGENFGLDYQPGEGTSALFGGNSNWRGPVWMPINYLIIRSIRKYGEFYGDHLKVECPVGSGNMMNLTEVSQFITDRVISLFAKDPKGNRKSYGDYNWFYKKPGNEDLVLFFEYFHGDSGAGLGANHQTGWTSLVADLIGAREVKDEEWKEGSGYEVFVEEDEE